MSNNSHLMEVDPILVRAILYLMPITELTECFASIDIELLDVLFVFLNKDKATSDITSNMGVSGNASWL